MSATQVVSVSASREDELREEQAITSQQLDATYSRMDELAYAKSQDVYKRQVYIRPQRYTKEFVDREDTFTISVLGEKYRKALNYCGKVSGKNADNKIKDCLLYTSRCV